MQYITYLFMKRRVRERIMKKLIYITLLLVLVSAGLTAQVNGELTLVEGKKILHVWGNHYQRGYAQGYLLSQPIMQIFDEYIFQIVAMGNPTIYNAVVAFFQDSFEVEYKYHSEAQGIIDGMLEAGSILYIPNLGRNLTSDDLLTFNCIPDIYPYFSNIGYELNVGMYCASLSSWGTATQADTLLAGSAVITRFLDWDMDDALVGNPIMIVSHPSEPDEQKTINFGYPGLMGMLSGINESGTSAFLNMGNVHSTGNVTGLHPMLLSIRNGLESADYNDDGNADMMDVYDAIAYENYLSGTIVHTLSENPQPEAGIIEANNVSGVVMRTNAFEDAIPGMNLAATNHFRMLSSPVCCTRYASISDSLYTNGYVTAKRQYAILSGAAGQDNNMMAIQFTPSTGRILWANASFSDPAFDNSATALNSNELFAYATSAVDEVVTPVMPSLRVYPNPAKSFVAIALKGPEKRDAKVDVYNLKGQKINSLQGDGKTWRWDGRDAKGELAGNGIYLFRLQDAQGRIQTARALLLK
jgi:hypothetical protein